MIQASSLPEVIIHLDHIIDWCRKHNSRLGYFAVLYQQMTAAVLAAIKKNSFQDSGRMERLDTIFANRYLKAWDAYITKKPCSRAWKRAFDACGQENLTVIQHLLLGINTHINLDLAIAAAETAPGAAIHNLQTDFEKINQVIAATSDSIQLKLATIWFPLKALSRLSNGHEDAIINFSISKARKASWTNAIAISLTEDTTRDNYIAILDDTVVVIADRVINPGIGIRLLLHPVRAMEPPGVRDVIDLLRKP